jgi:hypothetical protein
VVLEEKQFLELVRVPNLEEKAAQDTDDPERFTFNLSWRLNAQWKRY